MAATLDAIFSERDLIGVGDGDYVWTPHNIAADRGCVAIFIGNGGTANELDTMTSLNLTWTMRVRAVDAGNNNRVEIWTAYAASALTAEIITQTCTSGSYNRRSFVLLTIAGTDAAGLNGNTATDIDSSPADPALALTADAAGAYLVAGLVGRGSGDTVVDANTTEEYSSGSWAGFEFGERVYSRASTGAGSFTLASEGDDPFFWLMAGLEVKAAAGGGGDVLSAQICW